VVLLLVGAEGVDGVHDQRPLDRREGADARVAPLQLLHDDPVGDVVEPGAAVLLGKVGTQDPQLRHLRDELPRHATVHVGLADDGHEPVLHPGADGVADHPLLLGEERVEVVEVEALEGAGHEGVGRGWRVLRRDPEDNR